MADDFFQGVDRAVEELSFSSGARLEELVRLSREVMSALDVGDALVAAGEAVRQVCDGERFVVLLDAGEEGLQARAARDAQGVDLPLPARVCDEACAAALASGEVVFVHLPLTHPRWGVVKSIAAMNLVGFIAVPMLAQDGRRGVIYADGSSRFVRQLGASATEMLLLLAGHAALAAKNAEMLQQAQTDSVAPLPTRAYFERRVNDELSRSARYKRPFSIVYVDIENADALITRYDLAAVDELVMAVAAATRRVCRDTDLVGRVGPARLGLLLPEQSGELGEPQEVRALTERLRAHLTQATFKVRDVPQPLRVIIGAVVYQQAPLFGLKGILHEAELAIDVARREHTDHFISR